MSEDHAAKLESSPVLRGEHVAFTGTLASMPHQQGFELVAQFGGVPQEHVSRHTTMLVVGEQEWPLDADGRPTQKLQQFLDWQQRGSESRLVNESDWLHLLDLHDKHDHIRRLHTSTTLSKLLGVSVTDIRRWERIGLIRPARKVYRLSYFDLREVAGARKLHGLLAAGVSGSQIQGSLEKLRQLLPDVERPLSQLEILNRDSHLLYRDAIGLMEPATGQRFFDFNDSEAPPRETPSTIKLDRDEINADSLNTDWFETACRAADEGEMEKSTEALRLCLMEQPADPWLHFQLAETLYRQGEVAAAVERYYAAVEQDHEFIEAWTQLGCVLEEIGNNEPAADAFRAAISLHADYADAHRHLAAVLDALDRREEAERHWQEYLRLDETGPWAQEARQRLKPGF